MEHRFLRLGVLKRGWEEDELAKREVDSTRDFESVFGKLTRVNVSPTGSYEAGLSGEG
jgi:hypothetical protein